MPSAIRGLLVLVLLGLAPAAAQLAPSGSELQVNSTAAGFQTRPAAAADPSGNFVLVWQGPDGDGTGIFARPYQADGTPRSGEVAVNGATAGCQRRPRVAMGAAGFAVVWEGESGSGWDVYVRRFDASGTPLGPDFRVNSTTAGDQRSPAVSMDASGAFAVAWQSGGDVLWQRFSAAGSLLGTESVANVTLAGLQHSPAVAHGPSGEAVVVWQSQGVAGTGSGIFGRSFSASGTPRTGELRLDTAAAPVSRPAVGLDSSGNFVAVWEGDDASGPGVRARRFATSGSPLGAEVAVNATTAGAQDRPAVASQDSGDFVAVWESETAGGPAAFGQHFDLFLQPRGGEVRLHPATAGERSAPPAGSSPSGRATARTATAPGSSRSASRPPGSASTPSRPAARSTPAARTARWAARRSAPASPGASPSRRRAAACRSRRARSRSTSRWSLRRPAGTSSSSPGTRPLRRPAR